MAPCPVCCEAPHHDSNNSAQSPLEIAKADSTTHQLHEDQSILQVAVRAAEDLALASIGLACAYILLRYDPEYNRRLQQCTTFSNGSMKLAYSLSPAEVAQCMASSSPLTKPAEGSTRMCDTVLGEMTIPQFLYHPTAQLFLCASIFFGFSIALLLHSQRKDKYRHHIYGIGIPLGMVVGAVSSDGIWLRMKGYLAGSIVLALMFSGVVHSVDRIWPGLRGVAIERAKGLGWYGGVVEEAGWACDKDEKAIFELKV